LLLIGAGNHESRQLAARQFLAEGAQPCGQRYTAVGFFECLEVSFEHRMITLESGGRLRNAPQFGIIHASISLSALDRMERFVMQAVRWIYWRGPGVSQLNEEGMHDACFHV